MRESFLNWLIHLHPEDSKELEVAGRTLGRERERKANELIDVGRRGAWLEDEHG
jgi:hypothetical protein